jgi:hypothetical protein
VNTVIDDLRSFYDSPECPMVVCDRYLETVNDVAQGVEEVFHRHEHAIKLFDPVTHYKINKTMVTDLKKRPGDRCQVDTGWLWVIEQLFEVVNKHKI